MIFWPNLRIQNFEKAFVGGLIPFLLGYCQISKTSNFQGIPVEVYIDVADLDDNYVEGGQGSELTDSDTYLKLRPLKQVRKQI